jgi:hypothetical protein
VRPIEPIGPRPIDPPVPGERSRRREQGDQERGDERREREPSGERRPRPEPRRPGDGHVDVRA